MKNKLSLALLLAISSTSALAHNKVHDEESLLAAIERANNNPHINTIKFKKRAYISLNAPVIYTGSQAITFLGNGVTLDGSNAGSFILDDDLTAVTEDATLLFNTAANITLKRLSVKNSATRGIAVNIPEDAIGDDISVRLDQVSVVNSALYGLHIDDNADEFDEGNTGSDIGIDLDINRSSFTGNGTGAIDFDGIRVDERGEGDIRAIISQTHIDANGGDGIELDEAGNGNVDATMIRVSINDNGFYNEEDLDDGFDIDEAGDGDIDVTLYKVVVNNNKDEGLDFDESGEGSVYSTLKHVHASANSDEAIKIDEEESGDVKAKFSKVFVNASGDDGIQVTELGEGKIEAKLYRVVSSNNAKYGIKMEQWVEEDEVVDAEAAGYLKARKVTLSGNSKGDEINVNNLIIK